MRTDFTDYLFRCSQLGKIMTGANSGLTVKQEELFEGLKEKMKVGKITDKQIITYGQLLEKKNAKPTLSQTAKTYLNELHKEVLFGRTKEITNKFLSKGIQVEEQSITLYSEVTNTLFIKNKERFNNEFLTGEPDNIQGKVRDIKSSWDFSTFPIHDLTIPNKDYYWQLQGYMDLTGINEADLIYCLVDTPETIVEDEKRRTSWKTGYLELPKELEDEIERNMNYNDIPPELRVKVFSITKNEKDLEALKGQIKIAREYLTALSLKVADRLELVA